jgi:hypothetical protein
LDSSLTSVLTQLDVFLAVGLVCANDHERRKHRQHPQLIARPDLLFLFPPEKLHRQKHAQHRGEQQGGCGAGVIEEVLIAEKDSLKPRDQVGRRHELRGGLRPLGQHGGRERRATQKEHGHVENLDGNSGFLHGVAYHRQSQATGSKGEQPQRC